MVMNTNDVILACEKIQETLGNFQTTWTEIRPAVDGIVFRMNNNTSWKYWYISKTITKLEPWRKVIHD